jgi:chemotaxis protein MotB
MSSSRGRRHYEDEHEEHVNHEAWVIPYADVLTLLMALFLVLFALGRTDEAKLKIAADSFRRELGVGVSEFNIGEGSGPLGNGGTGILDGAVPAPMSADAQTPPPMVEGGIAPDDVVILAVPGVVGLPPAEEGFELVAGMQEILVDPLTVVEQTVRERAAGTGLLEAVGFRRESRGLVVTIVTDQVLFRDGQAAVQERGREILGVVAGALKDLPNLMIIEGHTDTRPISTTRYPSNWELSTARATSVLRYLVEDLGLPARRVAAAGYADTHPIVDADDPASMALNRRVEIVVLAAE